MLERIADAPDGVLAVRAVGTVSAADYEQMLKPAIEAAIAERGKVRLVLELGSGFDGYSAGAAWEDLKLGTGHVTKWERLALVTDHSAIAEAVRVVGVLMPGEVKTFKADELDEALAWTAA